MKKNILIPIIAMLFLLCLSLSAGATSQRAESLIYQGDRLELYDTPLESYFDDKHPRLDFGQEDETSCTEEQRGYHGIWQVTDGFLFLVRLQKPCSKENDSDTFASIIFPADKIPIKATWFDGALHALYNKKMLELQFNHGRLIKRQVQDWPASIYNYQLDEDHNRNYWKHE